MPGSILVVRHPGPWPVPPEATAAGIPTALQILHREDFEVDTGRFAAQIDQGDWEGQSRFLAEKASQIRERLSKLTNPEVHYFGLAEVPYAIALGAYLGDEIPIDVHEFDRDSKSWAWPASVQALKATIDGLPAGEPISAEGSAVLRVELSFAISDQDVQDAVGSKHLCEVKIRLADGLNPIICKVRSPADLHEVRLKIRDALAAIRTRFPNLNSIYVFAAAPVSVCFALGQELKPRNSPPIQTYRYRKVEGRPAYTAALELSSALQASTEITLTDEERALAARLRDTWRTVLMGMDNYVGAKGDQFRATVQARWYEMLEPLGPLREIRPFPPLRPVTEVVRPTARVDDDPVPNEYSLTTDDNTWHLSDRLLLNFYDSAERDLPTFEHLIRLFLFHESLHEHHSLSKLRAQNVGRFPNCLELIDYTADAYALLHQLDSQRFRDRGIVDTEAKQVAFLRDQLRLVLRSYWAFEPPPPHTEWQVRRVRRYLNWYWRLAQLEQIAAQGGGVRMAIRLLATPPHAEITGIHQFTRPPRQFCNVDKLDDSATLEFAVVMENFKLLRITETSTANLRQLLAAFRDHSGRDILRFFQLVFEEAKDKGGALPDY
jgi:hypothetical protein